MFWGIIHRTILFELLKIFFLSLVSLTGMILMAGLISEAMKNGFGPAQILAVIPIMLPSLLPYTVPTTTLFTTCIVYGRLAADNEILALKAAGVHIIHVVWPAVFLGAVTGAVTMFCYLDLIPATGSMLRNMPIGDMEELLYTLLKKDGCIRHPRINYVISVKTMQGRKLYDAQFMRKAPDGKGFDLVAWAKEAELRVDLAHKQIMVHMRQVYITEKNGITGYVESRIWPVEFPIDMDGNAKKFRAMDMTWAELFDYEERNTKEKQEFSVRIAAEEAKMNLSPGGTKDTTFYNNLQDEWRIRERAIAGIQAERLMRPALALGCLCFALVGCPVGIWFSKSDYLSAFITCFLPIVIIYYPMMFCMLNAASAGKLPAWMSIFNADIITLLIGAALFRRLARH